MTSVPATSALSVPRKNPAERAIAVLELPDAERDEREPARVTLGHLLFGRELLEEREARGLALLLFFLASALLGGLARALLGARVQFDAEARARVDEQVDHVRRERQRIGLVRRVLEDQLLEGLRRPLVVALPELHRAPVHLRLLEERLVVRRARPRVEQHDEPRRRVVVLVLHVGRADLVELRLVVGARARTREHRGDGERGGAERARKPHRAARIAHARGDASNIAAARQPWTLPGFGAIFTAPRAW